MKERRSKPRTPCTLPVFVEVQAPAPGVDDNPRLLKGRCVNISENGMQISTQAPLRPQAILRIFVINNNRDPISLVGEVRWTNYQDGRFLAGFEVLPSEYTNYCDWRDQVRERQLTASEASGAPASA